MCLCGGWGVAQDIGNMADIVSRRMELDGFFVYRPLKPRFYMPEACSLGSAMERTGQIRSRARRCTWNHTTASASEVRKGGEKKKKKKKKKKKEKEIFYFLFIFVFYYICAARKCGQFRVERYSKDGCASVHVFPLPITESWSIPISLSVGH